MEARQRADKFIKDCGFRKVSFKEEDVWKVPKKDFNSIELARFMKGYAYDVLMLYSKNNGGYVDIKKWWEENFVML